MESGGTEEASWGAEKGLRFRGMSQTTSTENLVSAGSHHELLGKLTVT